MKQAVMRYIINVAIGLDVLGSVLTGGTPNETISYRIGRMKLKYGGKIPWRRPLIRFIDWGLNRIDANHSIEAYDNDLLGQRILAYLQKVSGSVDIGNQYLQYLNWDPGLSPREKILVTTHLNSFCHWLIGRIRAKVAPAGGRS